MSTPPPPPAENDLIALIAGLTAMRSGVTIGIGDDAAVLATEPATVVTQDLLVDGVHFRRSTASLADIGHKAVAVNLSDLAAMGAVPRALFVGLVLPDTDPLSTGDVTALYSGMEQLAAQFDATIAGGDIVRGPALILGVTALGTIPAGESPATRSGAHPGDLVCVTGTLGGAAAGLAVLEGRVAQGATTHATALVEASRRPQPRVAEGRLLAGRAAAMMDCSDGLALDASRMAAASGVRIEIDLERLPLAPGVAEVAGELGEPADVFAATGGDDYELLIAIAPEQLDAARDALRLPLTTVGRVTSGPPGLVTLRDGREVALPTLGWEHQPGARREQRCASSDGTEKYGRNVPCRP